MDKVNFSSNTKVYVKYVVHNIVNLSLLDLTGWNLPNDNSFILYLKQYIMLFYFHSLFYNFCNV